MDTPMTHLALLMDIEARHEDLLKRLEELDHRVEKALADCQVYREFPGVTATSAPACA